MKKVNKWFWVWNQDAEKEFLENKAREGYVLNKVGFGSYYFDESKAQNLIYQMDFRGFGGKIPEEEYLQLYEDAGWRLAARMGGWYYFYQEGRDGIDSSIFNDNNSKRAVLKRLLIVLMIIGFPLYYQTLIMFPNMEPAKLSFPSFYFFFRILSIILVALHLLAVLKIYRMYRTLRRNITE